MKILVPVDLYESSYASLHYAVNFAALFEAEITILYVINSVFNTNEVISYDPYLEMETTAKERLIDFKSRFESEYEGKIPKVSTTTDVVFGIPGMAITEYANSNHCDLIIMGVRDKHGFLDRLMGSASTETVKEANCPVLLVHEVNEFKKPEKILFAFDKKTDLDDALEDYMKINDVIKAKTDFVHIDLKGKDNIEEQKAEIVSELFEKEDAKFAFEIKSLSGNDVVSSLHDYCYFENVDLVSMIHRKEGFFHNFLSPDKSVKLAQKFNVPVIVFQED